MGKLQFIVNYQKCTQSLNYLSLKAGGEINKMKSLKLIFFADRYHLRKYGRLLTNDNYLAMEHGPVPSTTKNIAESNDYLNETIKEYSRVFVDPVNNLALRSVCKVDKGVFSDSDLEALKFAWDTFGHLNQYQLRDLTHHYPEWKKFEKMITCGSWYPMDLLDFLKDPMGDYNRCYPLTEQEKQQVKAQILELAHIESLWGQDARCPA